MNPLGGPIVSGSGGPTEKISQLVDHFIGQIVTLSQSYIRDSTHLINILNRFTVQPGMLLCNLDITSLYTNIPHNEGIQSTKEILAIHKPPDSLPHNSYIIEPLKLVLTNNHFEFDGFSEHPMSLKKSIPYSQFLRLKRIHSEPQYLLEAQIHMYLFFIWREYPHGIILRAWMKTKGFTREQLLTSENNEDKDIPLMFITT